MDSNWTATAKKLSSVICNNKGTDQPAHPRSLISNFVVCFLDESYVHLLREKFQFLATCVACLAKETGLKLALLETQKTGFLASWPVLLDRQL